MKRIQKKQERQIHRKYKKYKKYSFAVNQFSVSAGTCKGKSGEFQG